MIAEHILRMAATRAKARALRDMTNIGMTCMEELSDPEKVVANDLPPAKVKPMKKAPVKSVAKAEAKTKDFAPVDQKQTEPEKETASGPVNKDKPAEKQTEVSYARFSEAQKRAIFNLSRRRGVSVEQLESMCQEVYGVKVDQLTAENAAKFIRTLQTAA